MKIAIIGALGRMGRMIAQVAREEGVEIRGACEVKGHRELGKDYGEILWREKIGVPLTDDFELAMRDADIGIEFTNPPATLEHIIEMRKIKKPYLTGTTGFKIEDFREFEETGKVIPLYWSPNMSYGVCVLSYIVGLMAKYLSDWDFEIMEIHHTGKKDAPSGTAKIFANVIEMHSGRSLKRVYGREGFSPRERDEIGIFGLRMGDVIGEHRIFFATKGERVELTHISYTREIFARGAIKAAGWLIEKKEPGFYSIEDLLGLR